MWNLGRHTEKLAHTSKWDIKKTDGLMATEKLKIHVGCPVHAHGFSFLKGNFVLI